MAPTGLYLVPAQINVFRLKEAPIEYSLKIKIITKKTAFIYSPFDKKKKKSCFFISSFGVFQSIFKESEREREKEYLHFPIYGDGVSRDLFAIISRRVKRKCSIEFRVRETKVDAHIVRAYVEIDPPRIK